MEIAVTGVIAKYTTNADGCGRVVIDLDEFETVAFQERFTGIYKGMTVVIARMGNGESESSGEGS